MDRNQKKTNHFLEFIIFMVMVICAVLIVLDVYTNVASELHGAFIACLA